MGMETEAQSHIGGHITLFFTVEKEGRLLRNQGSRGVGLNIDHGVIASVTQVSSDGKISDSTITIIDYQGEQLVDSEQQYRQLIDELVYARLLQESYTYNIEITLQLPTSQGMGMSAAGLIALATAFRELTGEGNLDQYYRICHRIERLRGSGLGDVLGIYAGGVEIRLQPGAPGASGRSLGFPCRQPVIVVWQPEETRHTSSYIDNPDWQLKITRAGHRALNKLKTGPWNHSRWSDILIQSNNFSRDSELLDEAERKQLLNLVRKVVKNLELQTHLSIRLCMLGISVVILPRKLSRQITKQELDELNKSLLRLNLGSIITSIAA